MHVELPIFMNRFFLEAVKEAEKSLAEGGIPIGAVLVYNEKIIGRGHNKRVQNGSSILHGEMDALENSGRHPAAVYQKSTMYTTLSPCAMCTGAIILYGIKKVVIGENETFMGEEKLLKERGVEVVVVNDPRCKQLMSTFISKNPELWHEDIGV